MADLPISNAGPLNGVTAVTALAAPASAKQRVVPAKGWSVYNADSAVRTITFQKNVGGTVTILQKVVGVAVGGVVVLDKVVVIDATNISLENVSDAIATVQPRFDIAAMETS